ncbi:hypothetical protein BIV57_15935 [Mangrovactinospora gilvigrisea]|uniref:Uncharacterized protein n=2 Tax=Mangrovactinospora gilvigrisea TaxID=1428644 RepID=A0A1J7C4K3_9ACTN|nr:hypothetical protein BIV57_15935 [Mangrovactinospora gilvigrisea]
MFSMSSYAHVVPLLTAAGVALVALVTGGLGAVLAPVVLVPPLVARAGERDEADGGFADRHAGAAFAFQAERLVVGLALGVLVLRGVEGDFGDAFRSWGVPAAGAALAADAVFGVWAVLRQARRAASGREARYPMLVLSRPF